MADVVEPSTVTGLPRIHPRLEFLSGDLRAPGSKGPVRKVSNEEPLAGYAPWKTFVLFPGSSQLEDSPPGIGTHSSSRPQAPSSLFQGSWYQAPVFSQFTGLTKALLHLPRATHNSRPQSPTFRWFSLLALLCISSLTIGFPSFPGSYF